MESIKGILLITVCALSGVYLLLEGMDSEIARKDYMKNIEICKPIDGCLFSHNCNHYNKIIEKACE